MDRLTVEKPSRVKKSQRIAAKLEAGEKRFAADIPAALHRSVRGYCLHHGIQMQQLLVLMLADRGITETGFKP